MTDRRCTGTDCPGCQAGRRHYLATGCIASDCTRDHGPVTATLRGVARPRGELDGVQLRRLQRAAKRRDEAEVGYRAAVLSVMAEGASFAEVSKATGLSTNTLQRWKRESGS